MNFCSKCGSKNIVKEIPTDDHRVREVCKDCNEIFYTNPRIVVGTIPVFNNKVLLAKRGIEPQKGKWNLPAGFLEMDETLENGARRETIEETKANISTIEFHSQYQAKSNHLYLFFLANLTNNYFEETQESTEIKFFEYNEIPWDEIAFESNKFAIKSFYENNKPNNQIYFECEK